MKRAAALWALFAAALLVRLLIAFRFHGSVDIDIEMEAGQVILAGGSAWTSKLPIGYFLPAAMHLLSGWTGIPDSAAQKFPAIAGDLLAGFLLWRYARPNWRIPAIYLLNPVTIMLSAYHGNVDPLMAAVMIAALQLRWREQRVASGVALGIAAAMKPTAILMLPALVLPLTFGSAMAVGATAVLLPIAMTIPFALRDPSAGWYLLSYGGPYGKWGFSLILKQLENVSRQIASLRGPALNALGRLNAALSSSGKYFVMAALMVWFLWLFFRRSRIDTFEKAAAAVAASFLVFYVFTLGFGVQYLSLALPFLLIVSMRLAVLYTAVLTPFLAGLYYQEYVKTLYGVKSITESLKALSRADLMLLFANGVFSLVAWLACISILARLIAIIRNPQRRPTPEMRN